MKIILIVLFAAVALFLIPEPVSAVSDCPEICVSVCAGIAIDTCSAGGCTYDSDGNSCGCLCMWNSYDGVCELDRPVPCSAGYYCSITLGEISYEASCEPSDPPPDPPPESTIPPLSEDCETACNEHCALPTFSEYYLIEIQSGMTNADVRNVLSRDYIKYLADYLGRWINEYQYAVYYSDYTFLDWLLNWAEPYPSISGALAGAAVGATNYCYDPHTPNNCLSDTCVCRCDYPESGGSCSQTIFSTCNVDEICSGGVCSGGNGAPCSLDTDCTSGNCDTDFDSTTKYCHATSTSCVDNSIEYANDYELCSGNLYYKTCASGSWRDRTYNPDTANDYCYAQGDSQGGYDLAATCSSGTNGGFTDTGCTACTNGYRANPQKNGCNTFCDADSFCVSSYYCDSYSCKERICQKCTVLSNPCKCGGNTCTSGQVCEAGQCIDPSQAWGCVNQNFEIGGVKASWFDRYYPVHAAYAEVTTQYAEEGSRSLKVHGKPESSGEWNGAYTFINIEPYKIYKLSAKARVSGEGFSGGFVDDYRCLNSDDVGIGRPTPFLSWQSYSVEDGDISWKDVTAVVQCEYSSATKLKYWPLMENDNDHLTSSGYGYVDSVNFQEISTCTAGQPVPTDGCQYGSGSSIDYCSSGYYCSPGGCQAGPCCIPSGDAQTCLADGDCCGGSYCSTENPTTGVDIGSSNYHCCADGWWWNPDVGIGGDCVQAATCYSNPCTIASGYPFNPPTNWWTTSDCIPSTGGGHACCAIDLGTEKYVYQNIATY